MIRNTSGNLQNPKYLRQQLKLMEIFMIWL